MEKAFFLCLHLHCFLNPGIQKKDKVKPPGTNSFKKGAVHQAQERHGACEIEGGGTVQKKSGRGI
jgi:hypothetical protein